MKLAAPPVIAHMPNGKPAPHVMTAEQVCRFLQLHGRGGGSLRRLDAMRQRGLEARQIGTEARFLLSDVLRWLDRTEPPRRRGVPADR